MFVDLNEPINITNYADQIAATSDSIDDEDMVMYAFVGLDVTYNPIVCSITTRNSEAKIAKGKSMPCCSIMRLNLSKTT